MSAPWSETYAVIPSLPSVTQPGRCPAATVWVCFVAVSATVTALPSWSATTTLPPSGVTASPAGNSVIGLPSGVFVGSVIGAPSVSFVPSYESTRIFELAAALV